MARTLSKMLELGTIAPDFELFNPETGKIDKLNELKSDKATVIMFICNHCPFVIHILKGIKSFADEYISKGVSIIAINSNDVDNYPADSPENMVKLKLNEGLNFPYLFDESQEIAKAYNAACTPDIYLFDKEMNLVYRGQFDGSRPENGVEVTGIDLRNSVDALLNGQPISEIQIPSIGCNIKWKSK